MGFRVDIEMGMSRIIGWLRWRLRRPAPEPEAPQYRYVDSIEGSDETGDGSYARPFATYEHALRMTFDKPTVIYIRSLECLNHVPGFNNILAYREANISRETKEPKP